MAKSSINIKQSFKDVMLLNGCYFFLFLFLMATFSDGSQTTEMFIVIDFLIVIVSGAYYLILTLTIQVTGNAIGIFTKALLFFILAELSVLTITGQLPLFGFLQKYAYSKKPYSNDKYLDEGIYLFRHGRDLAFLIAGLTSAIVFLIINKLNKKKTYQRDIDVI